MTDFLITSDKIIKGMNFAIGHANSLLITSEELFNQKKHAESTALAILSYEESAKANWLLRKLQEDNGVTKKDWKSLLDHDFKLSQLEKENMKMIDEMSDAEMKIYLDFQQETVQKIAEKSKEEAISKRKDLLEILKKFNKIKKLCFYSDWDDTEKKWKSFRVFPKDDQYAMNYTIIHLAENLLGRIIFLKDLHENPSKSAGIKGVVPDVEKNQIIELEDHSNDIENRKSFQDLQAHFENSKKYEPLLAKGWIALKKYF
ncbi:AbiV family abortive infection protein [Nitrosopumilus piranensis]|uniref:AbiV family abortive infection protein n=1 Tax=Nitrosopumilus piranensis TaxID=1582439 RepID=A0A0C5CBX7_9ARCH|nr:AbiV family abortive infection protein [Nitrosopumilus piranensis]AJM92702.1 hypothetical protein NPIRD3C_1490 [Nitrosopumilus piranensis]